MENTSFEPPAQPAVPGLTGVAPAVALQEVAALIAALPGDRVRWVAVDGGGASGKTSFAEALAAVTGARIVHGDDFAEPGLATWNRQRFVREVVEPLVAGRAARYAIRGWDAHRSRGTASVPAGSVVVVEGVSVLDRRVEVDWDVVVWLEAPRHVRLARAVARDGEALRGVWEDAWLPSEEAWMREERPWLRADVIVDAR